MTDYFTKRQNEDIFSSSKSVISNGNLTTNAKIQNNQKIEVTTLDKNRKVDSKPDLKYTTIIQKPFKKFTIDGEKSLGDLSEFFVSSSPSLNCYKSLVDKRKLLSSAIQSHNTSLIYSVLSFLKSTLDIKIIEKEVIRLLPINKSLLLKILVYMYPTNSELKLSERFQSFYLSRKLNNFLDDFSSKGIQVKLCLSDDIIKKEAPIAYYLFQMSSCVTEFQKISKTFNQQNFSLKSLFLLNKGLNMPTVINFSPTKHFLQWIRVDLSMNEGNFSFVNDFISKKGTFTKFLKSKPDINLFFLSYMLYDSNAPSSFISSLIENVSSLSDRILLYKFVGDKNGQIDTYNLMGNMNQLVKMKKELNPSSCEYSKIEKILLNKK